MDFGIYPPEINSGRMYSGPGSGPMLAAAQAWMALADELYTAAGGYQSVVSELTSEWSGPSSASMSAAAASFVEWLSVTAAQAEESATHARAAAAGYDVAFAMTVPPPAIAANRSLLATLVATNLLGQNTPAIAATEILYAEMWAQDAAAMYGYAASSAVAAQVSPFTQPQQTTDAAAPASQAAAVSQATNAATGNAQDIVFSAQQAFSAVPDMLQSLSVSDAGAAAADPVDTLASLVAIFLSAPAAVSVFTVVLPLAVAATAVDLPFAITDSETGQHSDRIVSSWNGEDPFLRPNGLPSQDFPATLLNPPYGSGSTISASMAEAEAIGELSVPSNWTVASPEVKPAALSTPLASANASAAPAAEASAANTVNQMGIGGMAGQAVAGPPAAAEPADNGRSDRLHGAAKDEHDDDTEVEDAPRTVMTGVAAAIRDIHQQRNAGQLSEQDYRARKRQLLDISFGR